MARPLTRLLGIPAVVTVHLPPYYFSGGAVSAGFGRRLYSRLERALNFRCTDRLIYASRAVMREADALGLIPRDRAVFIGNGIDLARYADGGCRRSARAEFGVGDDERVLCSVGRLEEQKGVDVLLEAFGRLDAAALRVRLWVIGDGALRGPLTQQARRLGLTDRVQFLGFRRDAGRLLAAADVFALASRYEAMPLAVIEAMASGLPCVVTDAGEQGAMVEDGVNGLVVRVGDAGALSRALERLLADAGLCREMGRASRRKAARYDERETAARVEEVYALLARGPQF
jgi:L-malate glycosyltransferase